jgi:hypothetical protein
MRAQGLTLALALALSCITGTAHAVAETVLPLQREVGRELALQTIYWVEKEGLPPRSKSEYDERKRSALQFVGEDGANIDREQLSTQAHLGHSAFELVQGRRAPAQLRKVRAGVSGAGT